MAKIIKCDRCGKAIEPPKTKNAFEAWADAVKNAFLVKTQYTITRRLINGNVENPREELDLCDECIKALKEWLHVSPDDEARPSNVKTALLVDMDAIKPDFKSFDFDTKEETGNGI